MTTAARVLDVARSQIGTVEARDGSNPYGRAYGVDRVAWCMQFVWWCFREAKAGHLIHPKTAYTPTAYDWHRSRGQASTTPRVGSLVFFDWPDSVRRIQHVGLVEAVEASAIVTIEGNTSTANQSDGGRVMRRRRARNSSIVGYGHPAYAAATASPAAPGGDVSRPTIARGATGPAVEELHRILRVVPTTDPGYGTFGPRTVQAVETFQRARGLKVDGVVGPTTWAALLTPTPPAKETPVALSDTDRRWMLDTFARRADVGFARDQIMAALGVPPFADNQPDLAKPLADRIAAAGQGLDDTELAALAAQVATGIGDAVLDRLAQRLAK